MQKIPRYSVPLLGVVALALSGCGTTQSTDDRTTSAPPATQAALDDGAVTGPDNPAELYLAAIAGGLSAVTSERGFPTNSDLIRAQVGEVLAAEAEYRCIQ